MSRRNQVARVLTGLTLFCIVAVGAREIPPTPTCLASTRADPGPGLKLFADYKAVTEPAEKLGLLGEMKSHPSAELTSKLLFEVDSQASASKELREALLETLGHMGADALPVIGEQLKNEKVTYRTVLAALDQLGRFSPDCLKPWLQGTDCDRAYNALSALADSDASEAADLVRGHDPATCPNTSHLYYRTIVKLDGELGISKLRVGLIASDPQQVMGALLAIYNDSLVALHPDVIPLLSSQHREVADQAADVFSGSGVEGLEERLAEEAWKLNALGADGPFFSLVYGFHKTKTEKSLNFLKDVVRRQGVKGAPGRLARETIKEAGLTVTDAEGTTRPAHIVVEWFHHGSYEIDLVFLTEDGLAIKKEATLRIGCCGKKKKKYKVKIADFTENGSLILKLNCKPEPCNSACVEIQYEDASGEKIEVTEDLDKFYSC